MNNIPPKKNNWDWSAFLLGPFWALFHRLLIGLIGIIPLLVLSILYLICYLGPVNNLTVLFLLVPVYLVSILMQIQYTGVIYYVLFMIFLGSRGSMILQNHRGIDYFLAYKNNKKVWSILAILIGLPLNLVLCILTYYLGNIAIHIFDGV